MNPIDKVSSAEIATFAEIVNNYGDPSEYQISPQFDIEKFPFIVRFWNENKKNLFKIFKNNLILEKEITIAMAHEELEERMYYFRRDSKFYQEYTRWIYSAMSNELYSVRAALRNLIYQGLCTNVYNGETIKIKDFKLQSGAKVMKALRKLNDLYIHSNDFENFRLEHSMILNQKEVKGTLCLSIHPLDYITMSDNSYEWDSCMSWIEDRGSHRCGTIEMMNSPCVVVAYIKGERPYHDWNDKKWRCLFIVTKDLISAIKAYPYDNQEITKNALDWLRDLATEAQFSEYRPNPFLVSSGDYIELNENEKVRFFVRTNHMYNDYYAKHLSYISNSATGEISINYSGELNCMLCGDTYYPYDTEFVGCETCYPYFYCEGCEEWVPDSRMSDENSSLCCDCVENDEIIF